MHDLVIRGGTIIDGRGAAPFEGDLAIDGGKITAVGRVEAGGREEIDARGQLVTPGFVDIHTHYDGQVVWSNQLLPSSWHGVTTAVMGNCGVGFAPCRPDQHEMLIRLMEGVEDIPEVVLTEGLTWEWETFPDYLETLAGRQYDIDIATQVPHAALRVYVMGERGANREPATEADRAKMARLAAEAVEAGALGFSTSRTLNHRASDGSPTPTLAAAEEELMSIAQALGDAGRGVLQVVSDFEDVEQEFGMLRRLSQQSGRPLSVAVNQREKQSDQWRKIMDRIEDATAAGLPIKAQSCGRAIGMLLGLELTHNPFTLYPSYREIAQLPFERRLEILRQPEFREKLLAEGPTLSAHRPWIYRFDRLFELGNPPNYEPAAEDSVAARAERTGIRPEELAYDLMLQDDGRAMLYRPLFNYADNNLDVALTLLQHPDAVVSLSDGGAHVGTICDASQPTFMLTHWGRDRTRGPRLDLPTIVKAQSRDTAAAVGLLDRGILAPGYKADVNVIDFDKLQLHPPRVAYDLPRGGRRLLQQADGYTATIVSGAVVYRNGEATGVLAGRLIRGQQPAPADEPQAQLA